MKFVDVKVGVMVGTYTSRPEYCPRGIIEYVGPMYFIVRNLDGTWKDNAVMLVKEEDYDCWELIAR